jgi:hypothetical protein
MGSHTARLGERLGDAGLLLVVVFMVPVAILVVGTPVALVARLIVEIAERW